MENVRDIFNKLNEDVKFQIISVYSEFMVVPNNEKDIKEMIFYYIPLFPCALFYEMYKVNEECSPNDNYLGVNLCSFKFETFNDIETWIDKVDPGFFPYFDDPNNYEELIKDIDHYNKYYNVH